VTATLLRYHPRARPVPPGWRSIGPVPGHHGIHYEMLEADVTDRTDDVIAALIDREGGYVHHPADRGGPTKHGITLDTLRAWRGDDSLTAADVRALTRDEAATIYRHRYLREPGIDRLPDVIQPVVLDGAVLHGPADAIRQLQRATDAEPVDGVIGPVTLEAARRTLDRDGADGVHVALVRQRVLAAAAIVERDHSQGAFIGGWCRRALEWLPA